MRDYHGRVRLGKNYSAEHSRRLGQPCLLLADEPTGTLDSHYEADVFQVSSKINEGVQTILMVTHSTDAASHANRILSIRDGKNRRNG